MGYFLSGTHPSSLGTQEIVKRDAKTKLRKRRRTVIENGRLGANGSAAGSMVVLRFA